MDDEFDLVAIGGGTAGLVTAAGAAQLGARTALVERDRLGGECLWTGCVPSKALIGSARIAEAFRRAADFGLDPTEPEVDTAAVLESVRAVRSRIQPHDDPERFRAMGVDVVHGEARFASPREIVADGRRLRARKIVIATGSRPAIPPIPGLEETGYHTHETAFDRERLPGSVIVLGGGPIGVEFAQAYVRLGVQATLVEMEPRILPREDEEVTERLRPMLEREGVRILTGRRAVSAARAGAGVELAVQEAGREGGPGDGGREALRADEILVATGRRPNVESLGLEAAGVETGPEGVAVDDRLRTSRGHVFAVGDVTGGLRFTHVADHEARAVIRNALFPFPSKVSYEGVPWCTFTEPAVARVGLTEPEAREREGDAVRVFTYDLAGLDRAIADRAAEGCVKLVTDRRGRLLGGHILAPEAGTMIAEVALAVKHGLRVADLSGLVHAYPTMSEGVRRAADLWYRTKLTDRARAWLGRWFSVARRLGI